MLQNERFGTDLKRYLPYAKIIDQSKTSDQYFRLFDVPDKLYVGKNSFRIRINRDTLVKGSMIYIDIVDSTGEIIFHEVADFIGEDGSRLIIVHVYEDTPPGEATIYIGGRASYDVKNQKQLSYSNDPSSTDFIDFPNIIWTGKVVTIPTNENENEIIFSAAPTVKVKERFEQYKTYTPGENRKVSISGSFNVTINPITTAYEYSDSSKSGNKLFENSTNVILDPGVTNNTAESRQKSIPQYAELSTLYDANGNFTEDFKGGEIVLRNLTEQLEVNDVNVSDFSCSIIEVVDSHNVKISPEFKFLYGEKNENVLKAIKNATNVTASYYTTKTDLITFDSESFIQLDFENLEPIAGKVDSVSLSYKPFGSFGEFSPIGEFRIQPQEYLVDTNNLVISKTELIERPIGKPSGSSEFATYWEVIPGKYAAGGYSSGSFLNQGIYFKTDNTVIEDLPYDYKLKLRDAYGIKTVPNTELKISFTINLEEKRSADVDFQLDVFISGSSILRDTIADKKTITLIDDLSEGERVSSVTKQTTGAVNTYTFYFKTISGGTIYPVFIIKNALVLSMKNISIQPRNEFGYSPNQAKLFVPLETLKKNTELVLNIDYLTKKKERSKISSQVYGLFFSGSGLTPAVVDDGLGGSGVFTNVSESVVSASVQTLGTSLYSFNPATTGFSTLDGIFLGTNAGLNASAADGAVMLGVDAGQNATNAEYSVMIGATAGSGATNSFRSIFIGSGTGFNASGADQSIFLGSEAGSNAASALQSNFIGRRSGLNATNANNSNFIGFRAGGDATDAVNSNFIGQEAGDTATNSAQSNFIGYQAGQNATNAYDSNFLGYGAGNGATNANQSNFLGLQSGYAATEAIRSNFIGYNAGTSATNAAGSNFIGDQAGASATNAAGSNFIGTQAGYTATNASESVFLGHYAGVGSSEAFKSNFIGSSAGVNATNADNSNFIGSSAGYQAHSASNSNFIGNNAGYQAPQAYFSNFVGTNAGYRATSASLSVFIGHFAGDEASFANDSNFIGYQAGDSAAYSRESNFIGRWAGRNAYTASSSNFIGYLTGQSAINANSSNFIGNSAGRYASSSSYSNFIGYKAGYAATSGISPSRNNIVIGTMISVPYNTQNQINIGSLIFGSGSYFPPTVAGENIFSGSANGKVGINQSDPQYSFDVSGSGNYTNGLTITGSVIATSFTGSLFGTASHATIKTSGSTIYTHDPLTTGFNTTGSVIIGPSSAGQNSTNSQFAVMIGAAAGLGATTSQYAVMMGTSAGNGASNSEYAVMLGRWAGVSATNASSSVMVGREAGRNATNTALSTFVGPYAGFTATNARNSTFIGNQAGYTATNANDSVFIGTNAGYAATNAVQSLFYGPNAGFQAGAATLSTFIGNESGYQAISASYSVFIGNLSGQTATSASFSTFIGRQAGQAATKASSATFIGGTSGYAATFANNGTFIGAGSGESAASASYSILIGNYAGATSLASNTIGSYNTVIGTGISVPVNSARALNICGLIFGTGSYASANLDAFSGSANGRIGINQPNPLYPFDVSGSANFSNDVLITGSLKVSGSNTFTNIGPAIFSGSATVYSASLQILSGSCNLLSSSLSIQTGSVSFNYRQVTSRYKIGDYDYTINCSPAATGIQVELPTAVGRTGRIYVIKNSSAYTIEIVPDGSETIDGASPKNLTLQYESITVQSTGTNWIIISKV